MQRSSASGGGCSSFWASQSPTLNLLLTVPTTPKQFSQLSPLRRWLSMRAPHTRMHRALSPLLATMATGALMVQWLPGLKGVDSHNCGGVPNHPKNFRANSGGNPQIFLPIFPQHSGRLSGAMLLHLHSNLRSSLHSSLRPPVLIVLSVLSAAHSSNRGKQYRPQRLLCSHQVPCPGVEEWCLSASVPAATWWAIQVRDSQ